jgi:hypothetical protein
MIGLSICDFICTTGAKNGTLLPLVEAGVCVVLASVLRAIIAENYF